MQTQSHTFAPELRKSLTAKGEAAALPQTPDTTVRRFFGSFSRTHRQQPEAAQGGAWNVQSVDTFFLLLRSPATFLLNSTQEAATDGVVMAGDAFKSFKWD